MSNIATSSVPDGFEDIEVTVSDLTSGPDFDPSVGASNVYVASDPEVFVLDEDASYKNIVVLEGTFNSSSVQLVLPYDEYHNLAVIDGILVNVGNDSVQGRFLYGNDTINPSEYNTYTYTLNPIYGNTSNVYNRGSFNFERHYYLDNSGYRPTISYDDTYGSFAVSDMSIYPSFSNRNLYVLLVIVLLLGGLILCLRKR